MWRLVTKMILYQSQEFNLIFLFERQQLIEKFVWRWRPYKTVYVNIYKCGHDDLTIESVHETTMTGYTIAKVFYLKCALETACKKATKWAYSRREYGQCERMDLKWIQIDFRHDPSNGFRRIVCV